MMATAASPPLPRRPAPRTREPELGTPSDTSTPMGLAPSAARSESAAAVGRHPISCHERRSVRKIGWRCTAAALSDLLPRKPVGAEVDSFEARVDADGERRATHANERAIVAKIPRARSEAREDAAETVEFAPPSPSPSTQTQRPAAGD